MAQVRVNIWLAGPFQSTYFSFLQSDAKAGEITFPLNALKLALLLDSPNEPNLQERKNRSHGTIFAVMKRYEVAMGGNRRSLVP